MAGALTSLCRMAGGGLLSGLLPVLARAADTAVKGAPAAGVPMADIHDIRPPVDPGIEPVVLYGLLAAAVAAALLAAGLIYLKRRRAVPTLVPEVLCPPHETALAALAGLTRFGPAEGRRFYFQLSAILRRYLEGRYGINAPDMTTEELLPQLSALALETRWRRDIGALLHAADPIKFAKAPAASDRMQHDLELVQAFVRQSVLAAPAETD